MPSWIDVSTSAPALADAVQRRFDAHGLAILATVRKDGFPRLSGIEPLFTDQLWLGMMDQSLKASDLLRDPRLSLHSATTDKAVAEGDAKITGVAVPVTDEDIRRRERIKSCCIPRSQTDQHVELFGEAPLDSWVSGIVVPPLLLSARSTSDPRRWRRRSGRCRVGPVGPASWSSPASRLPFDSAWSAPPRPLSWTTAMRNRTMPSGR